MRLAYVHLQSPQNLPSSRKGYLGLHLSLKMRMRSCGGETPAMKASASTLIRRLYSAFFFCPNTVLKPQWVLLLDLQIGQEDRFST